MRNGSQKNGNTLLTNTLVFTAALYHQRFMLESLRHSLSLRSAAAARASLGGAAAAAAGSHCLTGLVPTGSSPDFFLVELRV